MICLDNIINYLSGKSFDSDSINNDVDMFINNCRNHISLDKRKEKTIKSLLSVLLQKYKNEVNYYLFMLFDGRNDKITSDYHLVFSYPFDNQFDNYILKKIYNVDNDIDLMCSIYNDNSMIDNYYKYLGDNLHEDLLLCINTFESQMNSYNNPDKFMPDIINYPEIFHEINFRETYNKMDNPEYSKYPTNDLVGIYGEFIVLQHFMNKPCSDKFNCIWVSRYGNGFGYDIAIEDKETRNILGVEVKSTNNNNDIDTFKLTDCESMHAKDDFASHNNFIVIRYVIPEDKMYIISKGINGYRCFDNEGVEHKVECEDDQHFKITKTKDKNRGEVKIIGKYNGPIRY